MDQKSRSEAGRMLIIGTREWCLYFKPDGIGEEEEIGGREEGGGGSGEGWSRDLLCLGF
jgi:hypothetical protein